jgi:hypothetical protein
LPHDYFYNKNVEKYGELSFSSKNKARSDYSNLNDSEKLYYIKKFEKFYDNNEDIFLNENGEKLKLGFLLAKTELDTLFQNYGLPKPVPMSFFNYFVFYPNVEKTKESYNQGVLSARNAYKSLTQTELEEIKKNHRRVRKSLNSIVQVFFPFNNSKTIFQGSCRVLGGKSKVRSKLA